ncbi:hypothetical protein MCOR25_009665 [Pyricularia grisea]|uniref:Uncharacterized protein n=1 Tax=Pyricularia grisea TaxID=148305 RepID=A0A6P8BG03_PYRGI|nr:uncharacterized protein PgNI_02031 [Pyricularia grisea]KAI6351922.1 hypothetical protein MCOR25_009665 [Pyricularia grisea]TLD15781.1 hypothetical protein PgNI_02031 [Pyricularia grisea]
MSKRLPSCASQIETYAQLKPKDFLCPSSQRCEPTSLLMHQACDRPIQGPCDNLVLYVQLEMASLQVAAMVVTR